MALVVIHESRRPWRRETASDRLPDTATPEDFLFEDRVLVRAALRQLPVRQRAVVVLRFFDDLDVATTALILGCSTGTVKSHTARWRASSAHPAGCALAGAVRPWRTPMTHHDDDGSRLSVLLRRAVDDEPAPGFTADQLVARGRRARRVRGSLTGLGTVAAIAVIALVRVTVRGPGDEATTTTAPAAAPGTGTTPAHLR